MLTLPLELRKGRPFDVVGLGEISVDHLCLVPRFPEPGGKVNLLDHRLASGGQIATALVACQRLGLRTRYVGKVGTDPISARLTRELDANGIDTQAVVHIEGFEMPPSFVLVDAERAERIVLGAKDERLWLQPDDIRAEVISSAAILHLDATSMAASFRAVELARESGTMTSLDLDQVEPGCERLLGLVDLAIVSANVPAQLTAEDDPGRALRKLARDYPSTSFCVTLGAKGSLAIAQDELAEVAAFSVQAVDTTGCGDVFHGAFLYGLLQGWDVRRILRFSGGAAALATRALGAQGAIPTLGEVETFLARSASLS